MEAYAPDDTFIGEVSQSFAIGRTSFDVNDANGDTQLEIKGPRTCCTCGILGICCGCRSVGFNIVDKDGEEIGLIRKELSGEKDEITDADNFYITFPEGLPINQKIILIGGIFLLDYMFFEKPPRSKKDGDAHKVTNVGEEED